MRPMGKKSIHSSLLLNSTGDRSREAKWEGNLLNGDIEHHPLIIQGR